MATFEATDALLRVTGTLDDSSEPELRQRCREVMQGRAEAVTLDLTGVDHITSTSIGLLIALCIDLRTAGRRAILKASKKVKHVLDLTGLTETFVAAARPVAGEHKEHTRSKRAQF